ncbi:MAG: hypothetical protein H0W88_05345 [Parachlamydiaceae bacterium]|nr:hypothetical protein [Parachlamydiaceae bacterium]
MTCAVIDGFGVYGNYLHFWIVVFFVGSALMIFMCLWKKNRLDMDEEPKFQMMKSDTDQENEDK